tara:strand:- start:19208 stop:19882 length:675 start_codon:yes stop_codon:yes gene_type:complete
LISIIVPILNEASNIKTCIEKIKKLEGEKEIIFVDGGSKDNPEKIIGNNAKYFSETAGRAKQMNKGAFFSEGEVLLFLHCDTTLPPNAIQEIQNATKDNKIIGGGFLHSFDKKNIFCGIISLSANIRTFTSHIFFGDQAIFIRKSIFDKMDGYRDLPLFEDWDFSSRMKKHGKTKIIKNKISTSSRRIEYWGKIKTLYIWWGLSFLYLIGFSEEKLSKFYKNIR